MLFGESPKRGCYASAGAIAEVDQNIATKKISLERPWRPPSKREIAREGGGKAIFR
jgi:hypothetical protein